MTPSGSPNGKPDVEKIIEEIRGAARDAESAVPPETAEGVRAEGDFRGNLAEANRVCEVGQFSVGPKGLAQRVAYKPLGTLIGEINRFHAVVVRLLNRLVKILEGGDKEIAGELLEKTQRRLDQQAQMSERLAKLDDLRIEERLRKLEEQVSKLGGKDRP